MSRINEPLSLDELLGYETLLTEEERMIRDSDPPLREGALPAAGGRAVRQGAVRDRPHPEIAEMGILGGSLTGYGCAGMNAVAYGLAQQELEYGDSGLRSFVACRARSRCSRSGSTAARSRSRALAARGWRPAS
jgi:glutaryl-CoA dehydrogenase